MKKSHRSSLEGIKADHESSLRDANHDIDLLKAELAQQANEIEQVLSM